MKRTSLRKRIALLPVLAALLVSPSGWARRMPEAATQQKSVPPANVPPGKPSAAADPLAPLYPQAQAALDRGDYTSAIALLQKILAAKPDDALLHFNLGYAYSELKQNTEAVAEYRRALALNPALVAAHLNLGLELLDSDPAAAAESFRKASTLLPKEARPHYLAAQALERAGRPADAITEYNACVAIAPDDPAMHFALARVLLSAGRAAEAEAQFRAAINSGVVSKPNSTSDATPAAVVPSVAPASSSQNVVPPAKLGLAEALLRENRTSDAVQAFADYLAVVPDDRQARFERAVALQDLNRLDDALAELDLADKDQKAAPTPDSLKLRGSILIQQHKWAEAEPALDKASAALPQDAELHAWLGHTDMELHSYAPAEKELRSSLQIDPNGEIAEGVLGDLVSVYYFSARYADALSTLDLLEKRRPLSSINWFFRAICCDKLGQKADAAVAYQKFLDLDQGRNADQNLQARHRLLLLQKELQKEPKR